MIDLCEDAHTSEGLKELTYSVMVLFDLSRAK